MPYCVDKIPETARDMYAKMKIDRAHYPLSETLQLSRGLKSMACVLWKHDLQSSLEIAPLGKKPNVINFEVQYLSIVL